MAAYRRVTHITCRLTAKNRDQLRNPTLGNRVWATFTFFILISYKNHLLQWMHLPKEFSKENNIHRKSELRQRAMIYRIKW